MSIADFDVFYKSRQKTREGGVAVYARDLLRPQRLDVTVPPELEIVWVKLHPTRAPRSISFIVAAAIYHPPRSDMADIPIEHLHSTMDSIRTKHQNVGFAIMGDLNDLDISSLLLDNDFTQILHVTTRGSRTLDQIITNFQEHYEVPISCSPLGASDHSVVTWSPKHQPRPTPNVTRTKNSRPMRDSDIREFGARLADHDWSELFSRSDANEKCEIFYTELVPMIDTYFPTLVVKLHINDRQWMTPAIKSMVMRRQKAFVRKEDKKWRALRNKIQREIAAAKANHYSKRVQHLKHSNPSAWFQHIGKLTFGPRKSPLIRIENIELTDYKSTANKINTWFVNVASDIPPLDTLHLPAFLPSREPCPLVQPWEVYRELKRIKPRTAPGPDGIPARLVREFALELSLPLTDIFNASFQQAKVPERWKRACVVPIPIPKTTPPSIDNLRPVSLTDHFAKVAEKFIAG
ncbi:uncharacterized protein [Diadema antillarum]|uniref:uncharacterized protein n=1 Tax=Diadema antillarum TaxID=105358 RepID=UPI003A8937A2